MSYATQRAAALRQITSRGQPVTFQGTRQGTVDKATDRPTTAPTHVTATTVAVVLPQEQPRSFGSADKFEADALVFSLYRKLLVPGPGMTVTGAATYTPIVGDTVGTIEGRAWRVIGCKSLEPDGNGVILHTVIIKA